MINHFNAMTVPLPSDFQNIVVLPGILRLTQMISHIHVITVLKILQEIMILPGLIRFTHICHINAISVLKKKFQESETLQGI